MAHMEKVLDVYKRPYDPDFPVVCMDESPKQLIAETKTPLSAKAGRLARYDYEYERMGGCNIFMANETISRNKNGEDYRKKNIFGLGSFR